MIKRLISFFLTLVLLVAIPLSARYKYNPYTRKLDYYEAAADVDLGDLGDITLTGLANGDILYYNGTAWVNLAAGGAATVLTIAGGIPSWQAAGAPAAHAASHEVGGADLVDHNQLTNYLVAQHLTLPNTIVAVLTDHNAAAHVALGFLALPSTIAAVLTDHNKAAHDALLIDADTVDGEHAAAIVTNARVKAHFPDTIINVLSDHNLAAHTALGLFDASSDVDHNLTTNYAANQHVVLPATIAAVLTDHNLAAHTALGLFDASGDVDHNLTTNYVANQHINWTAAASNFSTSENFTLAWNDAADVGSITQTAVAGPGATPLIDIDDDRTGATANTLAEATIFIEADGYAALFVDKGLSGFRAVDVYGDFTAEEDVFWTWADAADHAEIHQANAAGIENQPLVYILDERQGATVDEAIEASLRINADGPTYAFYIEDGDALLNNIAYFAGDTYQYEDVFITWADAADHAVITQGNAAGIEAQALISIVDDRIGATANEADEATIEIKSEGPDSWAIWADVGKVQWDGNVLWSWAHDVDNAQITQAAVAGIEDVPLININDDRTGATANETSEATIYMDADGTYALYIADGFAMFQDRLYVEGRAYLNGSAYIDDDGWIRYGTGDDFSTKWDTNGAGDDLFVWFTASMAGANETEAFFISNLDPAGMTDHDNYLSPTLIITNDEAADANDYAGVVIGERTQASVLVNHYFDFYAMTGASDGAVDPNAAELAAIFRFGPNGTAVPGNATTPGDVLFEGAIEVNGNVYMDGTGEFTVGTSINEYSIDGTLAGNSDDAVPTEKAVKTYVDAVGGDVTAGAALTDHAVVRGDGGVKGVQTSTAIISDNGEMTNPSQPCFLAYNSVTDPNVTGDGTLYTVDFDTEVFDHGGNFAADTFTAPITGTYLFTAAVWTEETAGTSGFIQITTSNRTIHGMRLNPADCDTAGGQLVWCCTAIVDMDVNDTAIVQIKLSAAGGDTVDVTGGANVTTFSGTLLN